MSWSISVKLHALIVRVTINNLKLVRYQEKKNVNSDSHYELKHFSKTSWFDSEGHY